MKIYIEDLKFKCIIGILPSERVTPQKVIVNLTFEYKYDEKIKEFVDYSQVAADVKGIMKKKRFELIEEAVVVLKSRLEKNYPISNISIKITKPDILKDCKVSVEE